MTAQIFTTFEARRKLKEMAGVRERFQAIADACGPLAPIAERWARMLTVVDEQAMSAIKILEGFEAE